MAGPFATTDALLRVEVQSKESNFLAELSVFLSFFLEWLGRPDCAARSAWGIRFEAWKLKPIGIDKDYEGVVMDKNPCLDRSSVIIRDLEETGGAAGDRVSSAHSPTTDGGLRWNRVCNPSKHCQIRVLRLWLLLANPARRQLSGWPMAKRALAIAASALILVALALAILGPEIERSILWSLGLVTVGIAMTMSLATRRAGNGPVGLTDVQMRALKSPGSASAHAARVDHLSSVGLKVSCVLAL